MHMVKALCLFHGERHALDADNLEAGLLDLGENGTGVAVLDGVRLDDGKRALRHETPVALSSVGCVSRGCEMLIS